MAEKKATTKTPGRVYNVRVGNEVVTVEAKTAAEAVKAVTPVEKRESK